MQRIEEMGKRTADTEASVVAEARAQVCREQLTEGTFDDAIHQLPNPMRKILGVQNLA